MMLVSQAPIEKLQAYKRRMGWSIPWASASVTDFNFDLGFSQTAEQAREMVAQVSLPTSRPSTRSRRSSRATLAAPARTSRAT